MSDWSMYRVCKCGCILDDHNDDWDGSTECNNCGCTEFRAQSFGKVTTKFCTCRHPNFTHSDGEDCEVPDCLCRRFQETKPKRAKKMSKPQGAVKTIKTKSGLKVTVNQVKLIRSLASLIDQRENVLSRLKDYESYVKDAKRDLDARTRQLTSQQIKLDEIEQKILSHRGSVVTTFKLRKSEEQALSAKKAPLTDIGARE